MFGMGMMRQVQEIQKQMAALQEELGKKTLTASSGGGMVTVVATGKQEIVSISIDKSLMAGDDVGMLQDLVLTATNEALRQAREMMGEEIRSITGGIDIPGLS